MRKSGFELKIRVNSGKVGKLKSGWVVENRIKRRY